VIDNILLGLFVIFSFTTTFSVAASEIAIGLVYIFAGIKIYKERINVIKNNLFIYPVVIYAIATIISTIFSIAPLKGIRGILNIMFLPYIFFVGLSINKKRDMKIIIFSLIIAASISGLFSIYQHIFIFNRLFDTAHRTTGFFHSFQTYSDMLTIVLSIVLGMVFYIKKNRLLLILSLISIGIGIIFSLSRNSWLSIMISLFILSFIKNRKIILTSILSILLFVFLFPNNFFSIRFRSTFSIENNMERILLWSSGLDMIKDNVWFGVGPNNSGLMYSKYKRPGISLNNTHFHNTYIQIFAERGVFGFLAILFLMVLLLYCSLKSFIYSKDPEKKGISLGLFLSSVSILILGCFNNQFGDAEIRNLIYFIMGLTLSLRGDLI
jgi:O-antigen ligase